MIALRAMYDGSTYPVHSFPFSSESGPLDLSVCAVWFDIWKDGSFLIRRPGSIANPSTAGVAELFIKGSETDWGGRGAHLVVRPTIMIPYTEGGVVAVNLSLNSGFDVDSNADGIADNWTQIGTKTALWSVDDKDEKPAVIGQGGNYQSVRHATTSENDYIQQSAIVTVNPGDRLSVGVWHRIDGDGGATGINHAIFFRCGGQTNSWAQFQVGRRDWYFTSSSVVSPTSETGVTFGLDARGTTLTQRYDNFVAFIGDWRRQFTDPYRLRVHPRLRVPKTSNRLAGVGSFEKDSNLDGLPDGWMKVGTFTPTVSLDRTPGNFTDGESSLKVVGTGVIGGVQNLKHEVRAKFLQGETWRMSLQYKTQGALGGLVPAMQMQYVSFDSHASQTSTVPLGTNVPTFTAYTCDYSFATDCECLFLMLRFGGVSGTLWIDDVQLRKL